MVKKYTFFLTVSGIIAALDQATKALVMQHIPQFGSLTVIPDFFSITHVYNPGGAFGFMARNDSPLRHWLFLAAALFALCMIFYFYHRTPSANPFFGLALAMIFGGAVGNLIDRMRFGEVVDFLDVYLGTFHWPTFNVADSAVTVGVGIFIYHIVTKKVPI
ncbi:MAG: signal peptidase II [Desulfatitalea sp.]|nr:signal peptidase II [Desulfatitalea sp.]NNJ99111.1 signal peptidase II [Desulfatitalea sp.]